MSASNSGLMLTTPRNRPKNIFQDLGDFYRRQLGSTGFCYDVNIVSVIKQSPTQTKTFTHQTLDPIPFHGTPNLLAYRDSQAHFPQAVLAVYDNEMIPVNSSATSG